ncbi:outer membrane protein [Sulfitobacter guttiformis]|uniref:Opacity protein-like surface antigen n=1 Tax=Sulfitobacter guttiformis TaxID=74349 RepID=A0A420DJV6_9RHOB|nr:porin family protein [Sulfitobacter guttiformis]KIN71711.1 putative outer membrane protein [Sulfitobacter guttiformis KCTC 32187]RKE94465.1 opacity protein-like surface antigen [Sulfitobacter guttiformis]
MKLIIASVVAAFAATSAFAGSLEYTPVETAPTPIAPQAYNDLSWTGGYAGLQYNDGDFELSDGVDSASVDVDGFGIHGGYLYDLGQYVVGGELSYDRLSADGSDEDVDLTRLRGRVGYDFGKFMPYATLGIANISADDLSETGLTFGIGAEMLVTEKFSVGLEYSRSQFNDIDDVDGLDGDLDLIQLRGSFRF